MPHPPELLDRICVDLSADYPEPEYVFLRETGLRLSGGPAAKGDQRVQPDVQIFGPGHLHKHRLACVVEIGYTRPAVQTRTFPNDVWRLARVRPEFCPSEETLLWDLRDRLEALPTRGARLREVVSTLRGDDRALDHEWSDIHRDDLIWLADDTISAADWEPADAMTWIVGNGYYAFSMTACDFCSGPVEIEYQPEPCVWQIDSWREFVRLSKSQGCAPIPVDDLTGVMARQYCVELDFSKLEAVEPWVWER